MAIAAAPVADWTPDEDIVQHVEKQPHHTIFVAALKASGFRALLKSHGRYTVLAPNDAAFAELPKGMMSKLLEPKYRLQLQQLIGCHIIAHEIEFHRYGPIGASTAKTVGGCTLRFARKDGDLFVTDENGLVAQAIRYDVFEANGQFEELNTVLTPRLDTIKKHVDVHH